MIAESQILTLSLATVPTMVVVLIGILINNVRLGDLGKRLEDMGKRVGDMSGRMVDTKDSLRVEIRATREVGDAKLEAVDAKIDRNHSEMLHRFADLDIRIGRIETALDMGRG